MEKINEAINKYRSKAKGGEVITFRELTTIPIGVLIEIVPGDPGAIQVERTKSSVETNLSFRIVMRKGQIWREHHHDCEETIVVYKGRLTDLTTNTDVDRLHSMTIKPYSTHNVLANVDGHPTLPSIFYVEFKSPYKDERFVNQ
jgi:quercetin dioxygenase-like cupin family protein